MSAWIALIDPQLVAGRFGAAREWDRPGSVLEASAHEAYRTAVTVMGTCGPGRTSGCSAAASRPTITSPNSNITRPPNGMRARAWAATVTKIRSTRSCSTSTLTDEERFGSTSSMSSPATRFSTDVRLRRARLRIDRLERLRRLLPVGVELLQEAGSARDVVQEQLTALACLAVVADRGKPVLRVLAHVPEQRVARCGNLGRQPADRLHALRSTKVLFHLAIAGHVLGDHVDVACRLVTARSRTATRAPSFRFQVVS